MSVSPSEPRRSLVRQSASTLALLAGMSEAACILDPDGYLQAMNPVAEKLLGWRQAEIQGLRLHEIIRSGGKHSAGFEPDGQDILHDYSDLFICKDGMVLSVTLTLSPILDGQHITGAILIFRDTRNESDLAQALSESEERFRFMADSSPVMLGMWNTRGHWDFKNKAWLDFLNRDTQTELDFGWALCLHPEDYPEFVAGWKQSFHRHTQFKAEHRVLDHAGEYRWLYTVATPRLGSEGEFMGYIACTLDIHDRKQMELDLQEAKQNAELAESRYRLVLDGSNDAIWDWHVFTGETYWSDRYFRMLGYEPGAFQPTSQMTLDMIHPDDKERVLEHIMDHLERGLPYEVEYRMRHADGTYRYLFSRAKAVYIDDSTPIRMSGLATDITSRKLADQALRDSESRLRKMFDSSLIGIVYTDMNGAIRNANHAFCDMLGYTQQEAAEGRMNRPEMTPPEYRSLNEAKWNELQETQQATLFEKQYFHRDGGRIDVLVGATVVELDDPMIIAFVLDITEKRNVERALLESESRFRTTADAAPVLIWMADAEGHFNYFNRQWLEFTGRALEDELGDGWLDSVHPEDREYFRTVGRDMALAGHENQVEFRLKRASDNTYCWILSHSVPRRSPDGTIIGSIGSCVDITDIKRAKEAAEIANQRKSQFLATMSHELRTPLNAIIGFSEMLINGMGGELSEKQARYANNVSNSGKHLLNMVNDILDVAKVEAGKLTLYKEPVPLASIFEETLETMGTIAGKKLISLSFNIEPPSLRVSADPTRFRQILLNLIGNAIKFNRDGGEVRIDAKPVIDDTGNWVEIAVLDTGIGIPEDKLGELFTEFYQVNSSYSREQEGTGLGLVLTRRLVERHGGTISVSSQPGIGSTFTVRIPNSDG